MKLCELNLRLDVEKIFFLVPKPNLAKRVDRMQLTVAFAPPRDLCDITGRTARSSSSLSPTDSLLREATRADCVSAPLRHRLPSQRWKNCP